MDILIRFIEENSQNCVFFILGAFSSWLITHIYYKKSCKAFDKLPDTIKEILLETSVEKLSIVELNKIFNAKVYDTENPDDPLPYKCCPTCGSEYLKFYPIEDYEHDRRYACVECKKCGWTDSTEM